MNGERSQNTGCWIAALAGCGFAGLLGLIAVGSVFFFLFTVRRTSAPGPGARVTAVPADPEPGTDTPEPAPSPSSDDPDLHFETKLTPYTVVGASESDLRREMTAKGPADDGSHHDAFTHWNVHWSYPYDRGAGSCGLGRIKVDVTVTYTMPQWTPPPDASAELVSHWNRYRAALQKHEDGHRDHGVSAGRDVLSKLRGFGTRASCDDVNRDANDDAHRVVEQYKQKDVDYDKTTRHGATQGATFP